MAEAQIKLALSALARTGVDVREHDDNGRDVGDVVELAPGKSHTASLAEGHSLVAITGGNVEAPPKGKEFASTILTVTVEKDSTHNAKIDLVQGIAQLDSRAVTSAEPVNYTFENETRMRITRGTKSDAEAPAEQPAAA